MRKNFGVKPWCFPMPVLIIAAYDKEGKVNLMNAAWGGITDDDEISIYMCNGRKTMDNIEDTGYLTISFGTAETTLACDYVGIVSGHDNPNKLKSAGFTASKAEHINAPLIEQLPVTLECKLRSYNPDNHILKAEIVNISADSSILTDGKIDFNKFRPLCFEASGNTYHAMGEKTGDAYKCGFDLKK